MAALMSIALAISQTPAYGIIELQNHVSQHHGTTKAWNHEMMTLGKHGITKAI